MSETTLTHKDLAELLGVSETTIKSYRRKFPGCIPVASQGKPIRFSAGARDVALRIRDLFALGMSAEEVRLRLEREFPAIAAGSAGAKRPAPPEKTAPAPELLLGVSAMARSLVSITQQQKALLDRLQGIEALLKKSDIQGPAGVNALRQAEAAREKEALLEARLDRLDAAALNLSEDLAFLAHDLRRLLERSEETGRAAQSAAREQPARRIPLRQGAKIPPPRIFGPAPGEARALEPPR
ncbi:MAG: helix-turn-helix domain-containing protein, partial [Deltaproteobacteria bacterium]|nr:helix-turn-helix domain-containing protein [Deltaproteobacteria bacterium]